MRIVSDSNVWVSALVFGGSPRKVLEQAVGEGITIVSSEEIHTEVRRILIQKFPDFSQDFERLLAILQPQTMMVRLGRVRVAASRDEDDNRILETALTGAAEYIISGDKDLLVLSEHDGVRIVNPGAFLKISP